MTQIIDFLKYKQAREEANQLYVLKACIIKGINKGQQGIIDNELYKRGLGQMLADMGNKAHKNRVYWIEPIETKDAKYLSHITENM